MKTVLNKYCGVYFDLRAQHEINFSLEEALLRIIHLGWPEGECIFRNIYF